MTITDKTTMDELRRALQGKAQKIPSAKLPCSPMLMHKHAAYLIELILKDILAKKPKEFKKDQVTLLASLFAYTDERR